MLVFLLSGGFSPLLKGLSSAYPLAHAECPGLLSLFPPLAGTLNFP